MQTYSVSEFASRYKLSPKTVYKLVRTGQLKARRFGRVLRIIDDEAPELVRAEQRDGTDGSADP